MNKIPQPSKFLLRFFRGFYRPEYVDDIEGDLLERFEKRKGEGKSASRLFLLDVLKLFRPGLAKPFFKTQKLNYYDRYKNYFKIAR
jgi:putative ABC transport system permease protein